MADITSACLLKHRQLLMCRRGTLGATLETNLSQGNKVDCTIYKIKLVDALLGTLCRFNPDATLNCLTNAQICKIIQQCYIILPEEC